MRVLGLGFALALVLGGTASASDFVAVNSSGASIRAGQPLSAGDHIPLPPGASLTLIRPSGEIVVVRGAPGGVTLPAAAPVKPAQYAALQSLFTPPPAGRTFGARRGFCPGPEALDSLDAIIAADKAGCKKTARAAFRAYLVANGVSQADADGLYPAPPSTPNTH